MAEDTTSWQAEPAPTSTIALDASPAWRTASLQGNAAMAAAAQGGVLPPAPGNAAMAARARGDQAAPGAAPTTALDTDAQAPVGPAGPTETLDPNAKPPTEPEIGVAPPEAAPQTETTDGDPWASAPTNDAGALLAGAPGPASVPTPNAEPAPAAEPTVAIAPAPAGPTAAAPGPAIAEPAGTEGSFAFAPAPTEGTPEQLAEAQRKREAAAGLVQGLLSHGASQLTRVDGEAQARAGEVDAAGSSARAQIEGSAATHRADLLARLDAQIARAEASAAAALTSLAAAFDAAATTITTHAATARATVEADALTAISGVEASRDAMLAQVETLYTQMETDLRAVGGTVAAEARTAAAVAYEAVGDGHDDDLGAKRRAKWSEATQKVGQSYADSLVENANQIAGTVRDGIETDREGVRGTATQALDAIEAQRARAVDDITAREQADLATLQARRASAEAEVERQRAETVGTIEAAKTSGTATLDGAKTSQLAMLDERTAAARQSVSDASAGVRAGLTESIQALQTALSGLQQPDPDALAPRIAEATGQLTASADGAIAQLATLTSTVVAGLQEAAAGTDAAFGTLVSELVTQTTGSVDAALAGLDASAAAAAAEATSIADAAKAAIDALTGAASASFAEQKAGVDTAYTTLESNLVTGAAANVTALTEGLRGTITSGEVANKAREEGRAAAKSVQPWWKSVLKWVAIIAIAIVIAVVLGPLIIGALAPMIAAGAAALGASAAVASAIGTVVAGAAVGALGGYLTNGATNLIDGKGFNDGAGRAMLTGALGGAIGAGISGVATRVLGPVAERFAVKLGVDFLSDSVNNILTSVATNGFSLDAIAKAFTLEGMIQTLVVGSITNGLGTVKPVSDFQTRMTGAGEGFANRRVTGSVDAYHAGMTQLTGMTSLTAEQKLSGMTPQRVPTQAADAGPTQDGPTPVSADAGPTQDGPATVPDGPTTDATPTRPTGKQTAADLGWPAAPDGYHWVAGQDGAPPFLRRNPGAAGEGKPQLRFDPSSQQFIDVTTGKPAVGLDGSTSPVQGDGGVITAAPGSANRYGPLQPGPLAPDLAATFRSGSYTEKTTAGTVRLYRVYGGKAGKLGKFWTTEPPAGPLQAQMDLALNPEWGNPATQVAVIEVPAGTLLYEGNAAPQGFAGGELMGGGTQIVIPRVNPGWLVEP